MVSKGDFKGDLWKAVSLYLDGIRRSADGVLRSGESSIEQMRRAQGEAWLCEKLLSEEFPEDLVEWERSRRKDLKDKATEGANNNDR